MLLGVLHSYLHTAAAAVAAALRQSGHLLESVDDIIDIVNGVN